MNKCSGTDNRGQTVSIIIPAYNAVGTLRRCVKSVLGQSYESIEIIIVNDGSSDGTKELCDEILAWDERIKVIHQPNMGLSGARNAGIDASTGDMLFFLDSDDYIDPNEIEVLADEMALQDADLVVGGLVYVDSEGVHISEIKATPGVVDEEGYWKRAHLESPGDYVEYVVSWGKLFRRSAFRSERFDVGKLHEDEFIIHRLISQCKCIAIVDYAGYKYVQNTKSIMHNPSMRSFLDASQALTLRAGYFIDRGWRELAWAVLLAARRYLAESQEYKADVAEERTESRILSKWREELRKLKSLRGGSPQRRMKCFLLDMFPSAYVEAARLMKGKQ